MAGTWRSGWPTTALELKLSDGEYIVHAVAMNTLRMPSHLDLDARLACKFQLEGGGTLTAFFEISNILNRRNECCTEYEIGDEEDEQEFEVESIRSLPLLPSIGVIWRF